VSCFFSRGKKSISWSPEKLNVGSVDIIIINIEADVCSYLSRKISSHTNSIDFDV
jgi:ribosomal protein L11 methylase PrmA